MNSDLDRLYELMDRGFSGVHERLDALNGRTRENEKAIAVLQDRGVRSKDNGARWGVASVGVIGAVVEVIKQVWK